MAMGCLPQTPLKIPLAGFRTKPGPEGASIPLCISLPTPQLAATPRKTPIRGDDRAALKMALEASIHGKSPEIDLCWRRKWSSPGNRTGGGVGVGEGDLLEQERGQASQAGQ